MKSTMTATELLPRQSALSNELLNPRILLESTTDSICLVDFDWTITYINERAATQVKVTAEVIGRNLWEEFPELEGTEFAFAYRRAMEERVSTRAEAYYEPLEAWFLAYAHPIPLGLLIAFRNVTVRKLREVELRASEERFRKVFEHLTQGVLVHDAAGDIVDANPAAERIIGLSREEMRRLHAGDRGQPVDERGSPLSREKRPSLVAMSSGRPVEGFVMGITNYKDGQRRWVDVHAIPIFREGETKPYLVYALFADVTLRKQSELELQASEARLQRITRNLPVAVFDRVLSTDGVLSYPYYNANGMPVPLSGRIEPESLLWLNVHPEDRKAFSDAVRRSAKELSLMELEFRLLGPDGKPRWMLTRGVPRRLDNGDTLWECIRIDITEQKQAQEALRASEARARQSEAHLVRAQRVAGVGSSQIDFRSGEILCSDELYRIYGLDKKFCTLDKRALGAAVHPEDRESYEAALERGLRGEAVPPLEFRIVRPDGDIRTIYREVEVIYDDAGQPVGAVATKQDVTELRRAEQEHKRLRDDLFHAQRMDALGRLAGGIAHDINNTLVPVIGLTEAILKTMPDDSPDAEALAIVREAGIRAKGLVQQILTFSRRDTSDRQVIDIEHFLMETVRFIRATVPATIEIQAQFEPVPPITADKAQLHQLMINLVTNSVDAIGSQKGKITVQLMKGEPGIVGACDCVHLAVSDTGAGMTKETRQRIFEPFFTTKDVDKGTGLGLSVVYGIVRGHEGRIEVMSEPGKGTRFDIFLPSSAPTDGKGE